MTKKVLLMSIGALLTLAACHTEKETRPAEPKKELGFDLSSLDTTVQPCADFFQYVSGGWVAQNPIPETESRWGNFNLLIESNNEKVRYLLDSISALEDMKEGSYTQRLADYYNSGMDSAAVERAGLAPLEEVFARIEGIRSVEEYTQLLGYFKQKGISSPVASYVSVDDKNSDAYILQFSQSGLGLPDRDYYLVENERFEKIREAYLKHVADMLALAGEDAAVAEKTAMRIFLLEKELAGASMSREDRRKPENTYNKMGKDQFNELAHVLHLEHYYKYNDLAFDSAIVAQPEFFKSLNEILPKQGIPVLKAYARWNVLRSYSDYLPHAFVESSFDFYNKTLRGTGKMKPRWKRTINAVESGLGEQLGHLFVERYFPEESKAEVQNMVENLRKAYRQRIKQLDWMSTSTKEKALKKLTSFTYKIGYPNEWKHHDALQVSDQGYLENALAIKAYRVKENLDKLGKEVDRDEWFMPAHIVNAYYNPSYNEVVFPAGILQPPFYNPQAEAALNYGGIGGVIGHEFTHGFDDQGSKYNGQGNLENWWTDEDSVSFNTRTSRMVAQYSGYQPILDTYVNGSLTLGENIADLGGLTLAYYGYKAGLENGEYGGEILEGFTWQQRIFMGWGQVWQSSQTEEFTSNQVLTDPHSPARYRVIGPMSNMPEFAQAWNCTAGDAMVRQDSLRVEIW